MSGTTPKSAFAPTRWTLVLRARGESAEAREALGELCVSYYAPIFQFLRRENRNDDEARELTQEFFAGLLARGRVEAADPRRGKFRSYLLGALKHFLADQRDRALRQKRGGGQTPEPLDENPAALHVADPASDFGEAAFDRAWAMTIMERSMNLLTQEFDADGKLHQFTVLKSWLVGDWGAATQSDAAARLDMTESAVKVAIHRMRKRLREIIRTEIAQTVNAAEDVDEELRYLVEVLARD